MTLKTITKETPYKKSSHDWITPYIKNILHTKYLVINMSRYTRLFLNIFSQHLSYPWNLFKYQYYPITDYKHNCTKQQCCQHLIHLPIMTKYTPQTRKILFNYHMQQINTKSTGSIDVIIFLLYLKNHAIRQKISPLYISLYMALL